MKKILIFGSTGLLGSSLIKKVDKNKIISPTHDDLDLLEIKKVLSFIEKVEPTDIIYLAGVTKIDEAEKNTELALKLNYEAPKTIANHIKNSKIPFYYASTDAVFDGYKNKYHFSENDNPNPKSNYGKTKLKGENAILNMNSINSSVRLINLYGWNKKNFVYKMVESLQKEQSFPGITDQIKNPINVADASNGILFILENSLSGIYHLGSSGEISNYDFLVKVAKKFKLKHNLINKIKFSDFLLDKSGHRKQNSVLSINKFLNINSKILKSTNQGINTMYYESKS